MANIEQPYERILFTEDEVDRRIEEMAAEAIARYKGRKVVFVSLLNGAQPFATKLMFAITHQDQNFYPNLQSMIVSRYGPNRQPGALRLIADLPPRYRNLEGYTAVVLEDLIDGGGTLRFADRHLRACGAEGVESIVLARKHKDPPVDSNVVLCGFDDLPDVWLTGMGMDDERLGAEANRYAGFIAVALATTDE